MKWTGKAFLLVIAGMAFSAPTGAVTTEKLHCPGRPVMAVTVTGDELVTVQWKPHFFVGQLQRRVRLADSDNVRLYQFRNGDLWFVDNVRQRQFFAFGGKPPLVVCRGDGWVEQTPLELPYRYDR